MNERTMSDCDKKLVLVKLEENLQELTHRIGLLLNEPGSLPRVNDAALILAPFCVNPKRRFYFEFLRTNVTNVLQFGDVKDARAPFRLYKEVGWQGEELQLTYSDDCIDLPKGWVHEAKSAGQMEDGCITLWSELDCSGVYRHMKPVSFSYYSAFGYHSSFGYYSLNEILFSKRPASYQRCDTSKRGLPKELAQIYQMRVNDKNNDTGVEHYYFYRSGCNSLLKDTSWQQRISTIDPYLNCVALHTKENCEGEVEYIVQWTPSRNNLADIGFDKKAASFGTCDLYYKSSCKSCPKTIYKGGTEYEFWIYLFSIYSPEYRDAFESRVKQYSNGSIPWDFMFAPNEAATRPGDQYQDMIISQLHFFLRLKYAGVEYLNFNAANVDALRVLASRVLNERKKQTTRFATNWNDHDFVVHKQLLKMWEEISGVLEELYKWLHVPENDDCGKSMIKKEQTSELINLGGIANYGEDPWHVAIYKIVHRGSSHILLCGGTLVSSTIVISAGHCFYDKHRKIATNKTSDYEIYVGKYTRDYFTKESNDQKAFKIRELAFYPKGGFNSQISGHYGSDIIIITLESPVQMNDHVQPICLDWDITANGFNPPNGTLGRIVGWGEDDQKNGGSGDLLMANLPYISYKNCVGKVAHGREFRGDDVLVQILGCFSQNKLRPF